MQIQLAAAVSLALTFSLACNQDSDEKAGNKGPPSPMVTKLAALADKGCACTDLPCTQQVDAEVAAFAKTITSVTEADKAPMQAAQARLDGCTAKFNPYVISYKKLTDEVCACEDKACAQKSSASFKKWIAKLKAADGAMPRGHLETVMASAMTAKDCFDKHGVPVPQ